MMASSNRIMRLAQDFSCNAVEHSADGLLFDDASHKMRLASTLAISVSKLLEHFVQIDLFHFFIASENYVCSFIRDVRKKD
jgi:hypothetical protein